MENNQKLNSEDRKILLDIKDKIIFGVDLAFKKMRDEARKNNEELVVMIDGKITRIKA